MLILPYDAESLIRNADFIFIARKGDTTTLGPKGRRPLSGSEHNPPPSGGHNPRGEAPSTFPSEPFSPSVTLPHCITNWNKRPYILVPACSNSFQLVPQEQIFTYVIL